VLTITQRAAQELRAILESNAADPARVLRIDTECDGFSLWLGPEMEGDTMVGSEDTVLLRVSPELSRFLVDASVVIDCRESSEGPRLVVFREDDAPAEKRAAGRRRSKVHRRGELSGRPKAKGKAQIGKPRRPAGPGRGKDHAR